MDSACTPAQVVGKLLEKYRGLSPLLRKVEEAACGSNGGRAPRMAQFYAHCERAVFHALNALLLNAVRALADVLSPGGGDAAGMQQQPAPAFMVRLLCGPLSGWHRACRGSYYFLIMCCVSGAD
jgi:dynein heavy chain